MRGEHYYLVLVGKDGTMYKVFSKPITLRLMDERTTLYENKSELIRTIIENKGLDLKVSDFKHVEIWMEPSTKDKSNLKREANPLYKKDRDVLDKDKIASRFEVKMHDKDFALFFAARYKKVKNFKPLANGIESCIRNNGDYIELISDLGEKLFKTHKGVRNIYLSMKDFDTKQKYKVSSKPESILTEQKTNQVEKISEKEKYEDLINYLNKYERELLGIEDFYGYEQLSYFDGNRGKSR